MVSSDGRTLEGIVSERDVVGSIAEQGSRALKRTVTNAMIRHVATCKPDDLISAVARVMTVNRIRTSR